MGTFWDILLAVVCAAGLALVGWWLFGLLLRPLPGREVKVVLPGRGDGEGLEQQVRILRGMRRERNVFSLILLVDCGLSEEGKKLSRLLAKQDRWVTICQPNEIDSYLRPFPD